MDPLHSSNGPGPFIEIFGLIAAAVPGFLASWKRPGMAVVAIFMSVSAIVFAANGSRLAGDIVFAVIWTGAMLLAATSRVVDAILSGGLIGVPEQKVGPPDAASARAEHKWLSGTVDPTAPPGGGRGDPPKGPMLG